MTRRFDGTEANKYAIGPGADLGADLAGANLRNANLTGADLTDANLGGADLTGAKWDETTIDPDGWLK